MNEQTITKLLNESVLIDINKPVVYNSIFNGDLCSKDDYRVYSTGIPTLSNKYYERPY